MSLESIRALVEAVSSADDKPCCRYSYGRTDPWPRDWERIVAIAKSLDH